VAALTAITPTVTGTVSTGAAVAASDTIDASLLGWRGGTLIIINASGSVDNVTLTDYGNTAAGNSLTSNTMPSVAVAAGTSKAFDVDPSQANPATGLVTVTHSNTTTVTYILIRGQ